MSSIKIIDGFIDIFWKGRSLAFILSRNKGVSSQAGRFLDTYKMLKMEFMLKTEFLEITRHILLPRFVLSGQERKDSVLSSGAAAQPNGDEDRVTQCAKKAVSGTWNNVRSMLARFKFLINVFCQSVVCKMIAPFSIAFQVVISFRICPVIPCLSHKTK